MKPQQKPFYKYNISMEIIGKQTPQDIFSCICDVKPQLAFNELFQYIMAREVAIMYLRKNGKTYKEIGEIMGYATASRISQLLRYGVLKLTRKKMAHLIFDCTKCTCDEQKLRQKAEKVFRISLL